MTFNEWMGTLGNNALVHANCCRKAYEAGQQSQQAKVEELNQELHLVLDNWNDLTRAIHARTNGTAVAEARQLYGKVEELQKQFDQHDKWLGERNKDVQELYDINVKHVAEKAELQKRVEEAIQAINEYYESDGMSGLYFSDLKEILEGEQALKGEQ